jgi:hypothetical protein
MHRVKVGMTGLAAVLVLIGLGSAVFKSVSTEAPVNAIGSAKPDVVANMTSDPADNATASSEPLAELGVTPPASTNASDAK